jgi:uncharacterized alkaline shock family protein YloU
MLQNRGLTEEVPMSTHEMPGPAPQAEGGSTWIADQIVAKIAAAAAREVEGVVDLRGGGIRRGWVRASDRGRGGAAGVRIDEGRASIDLRLVVRDGAAIPAVVDGVRARVTERVQFGTGLTVARVDIGVVDVVPAPAPEPEPPAETAPAGAPQEATPADRTEGPGAQPERR